MKFKEVIGKVNLNEKEMKFQALSIAKDLHTQLAQISFIDMLAVMNPENPAKKEVQALEAKINDITSEVGEFIQKYIPDVAAAEVGDLEDEEPEEEPEEEEEDSKKKPEKDSDEEPEEPEEVKESIKFKSLMGNIK